MGSLNFGLESYVNKLKKQTENAINRNNDKIDQLRGIKPASRNNDNTDIDDLEFGLFEDNYNGENDRYFDYLELEEKQAQFEKEYNNRIVELSAQAAQLIRDRAIEYTPVDTGTLLYSQYLFPYEQGWELGYACEYAVYVHEISFNKHEPPAQYKFLEDAAYEVQNEFKEVYGVSIPIKIEYDPLRIFIGVTDAPGEFISDIKENEKVWTSEDNIIKMYDFLNSPPDFTRWNDKQIDFYMKLNKFVDWYYGHRHIDGESVLREFGMRQRHQ